MSAPLGAVLAGGRGARLGGAKPTAALHGRPLVEHAIEALRAVVDEVVVVARPDTVLPPGTRVPVWHDDAAAGADRHPRHGIVRALRGAAPRPVLVLAVDLPFVAPATLRALLDAAARAEPPSRPATWVAGTGGPAATPAAGTGGSGRPLAAVVRAGGRLQPLCALYAPDALPALRAAPPDEPLTRTVERLAPVVVDAPPGALLNVNTPADLAAAERRRPG